MWKSDRKGNVIKKTINMNLVQEWEDCAAWTIITLRNGVTYKTLETTKSIREKMLGVYQGK